MPRPMPLPAKPLPVVPRPLPGEHLTAWLWRLAAVYGTTAPAFLEPLWAERGEALPAGLLSPHPPSDALDHLADHVRLPATALAALTLPRLRPLWGGTFMMRIDGHHLSHRYCPACLAADAEAGRPHHLRADWACAAAFHCPVHDVALWSACPACGGDRFAFHGSAETARLSCARCRAPLGRNVARCLSAWHTGLWPAPAGSPLEEHRPRFAAFLDAVRAALGGNTIDPSWVGSPCPQTFGSMLTGLLSALSLPGRGGDPGDETVGHRLRLAWERLVPLRLPKREPLVSSFAALPSTTRFDLLVALYALVSGAPGLITFRTWRREGEDWRLYHMVDPTAQMLCTLRPDGAKAVLAATPGWGPGLATRFSTAAQALQRATDAMACRLVQRQHAGDTARVVTDASRGEQDAFRRTLTGRGDHDVFTLDDLLSVPRPLAAASRQKDGGQSRPLGRKRRTPAPPPTVDTGLAPTERSTPYREAAHAALASEAGRRFRQAGARQRRTAWFRLVQVAVTHLQQARKPEEARTPPPVR